MPDVRSRLLRTVTVVVLACGLAGCSGATATEGSSTTATPSATTTPTDSTSPSASSSASASPQAYAQPGEATDECGVITALITLNEQASQESQSVSIARLGERLRLIADGADTLSTMAPDDTARGQWSDMATAYTDAADFLDASGGQVSNDSFLERLSTAVSASNTAYSEQKSHLASTCDVDVSPLVSSR